MVIFFAHMFVSPQHKATLKKNVLKNKRNPFSCGLNRETHRETQLRMLRLVNYYYLTGRPLLVLDDILIALMQLKQS